MEAGTQKHEKDALVSKFSQNMRRLLDARDGSPATANRFHGSKSVSFNPAVVETSFGGTQTPNRIKDNSVRLADVDNEGMLSSAKFGKPYNLVIDKSKDKISQIDIEVSVACENGASSSDSQGSAGNMTENGLDLGAPRRNSDSIAHKNSKIKSVAISTDAKSGLRQNKALISQNGLETPTRRHTMEEPGTSQAHRQQTPECFNRVSLETSASRSAVKHQRNSGDSIDRGLEDSSGLTVAVRVRPYSQREISEPDVKCVLSMSGNQTVVTTDKGDTHRFRYDYSFWSFDDKDGEFADQEYVYNILAQPMLGKAFEGYNTCLFAYGQTGSGKSYSMMGHGVEVGIIPRFCEELFGQILVSTKHSQSSVNVEISYFEIYNEKIHDLLCPSTSKDKSGKKANLKVREHPALGPYVEGLSSYVVKSFEDIKGWLNVGNKHRATAATGMNDKSSRSHSVFTMVLTQTKYELIEGDSHEHSITSKINLVDLAGSERQSIAKTSGERLREGANINKSLMTLGKVISALSEQSVGGTNKKKKMFIPYRDSVLTWLLKESLGGNSKTAMLATISPANLHQEETLSTLRYAKQARSIINMARVNEDPKARLIRELRSEIDKLRTQTGGMASEDVIGASMAEIASLKDKLTQRELEMNEMTKSWQERLKKSEESKQEESRLLEKSGIAFKMDNKQANLVNLNEDPQLSEMLLYVLREGAMRVGRLCDGSDHEIQLSGALIADNHCVINNTGKNVTITPIGDAPSYVNGDLITVATTLHHGDRVILGGDHYFRFNHPIEIQGRKTSGAHLGGSVTTSMPKDFDFARQELVRVQNAR